MKRVFSILIICMFMLSFIPLAIAEGNENSSSNDKELEDTESNYIPPYKLRENTLTEEKIRELEKKRLELREKYDELKTEKDQLKERWEERRDKYLEIRDKLKEKRFNQDNDSVSRVQEYLLRTLERMDNHLEIMKEWVEKTVDDEELQNKLISELDVHKDKIASFKNDVNSADTIEELRTVGKEIKEYWREARNDFKKPIGIILSHRVYETIQRFETITNDLSEQIDELDQDNEEVKEMQSLMDELNLKLDSAMDNYDAAKQKYLEINNDQSLEEVKELLKKAHEDLREAHKIYKEVLRDYREFMGYISDDSEDDESDDDEDEIEDEDNETEDDSDEDENETESE